MKVYGKAAYFFAEERIHSNLTRVVVMVWLFVVFILSSSYTASLSSILTVKQLETVTDIEWLKSTNQIVGCDGDSFVMTYLMDVLEFKEKNIYKVSDEYSYVGNFEDKNISAAFFELPYEKVFLNKYCKGYTTTAATYRFGGLGFVSIYYYLTPIYFHFSLFMVFVQESEHTNTITECALFLAGIPKRFTFSEGCLQGHPKYVRRWKLD